MFWPYWFLLYHNYQSNFIGHSDRRHKYGPVLYVTSSKYLLFIHFYTTLLSIVLWPWIPFVDPKALRKGRSQGEVNEGRSMLLNSVLMTQFNKHVWYSMLQELWNLLKGQRWVKHSPCPEREHCVCIQLFTAEGL